MAAGVEGADIVTLPGSGVNKGEQRRGTGGRVWSRPPRYPPKPSELSGGINGRLCFPSMPSWSCSRYSEAETAMVHSIM